MLRPRPVVAWSLTALFTLFVLSTSFPPAAQAQINPVVAADGFEFNVFAGPDLVPDWALPDNGSTSGSQAGPTVMAFDSKGRVFVGTFSGKILILIDTDDDGRADLVKTFATGVSRPLGMAFRSNGDLFVASNSATTGAGRIIRLRDTDGDDVADEKTVIVDNLPSGGAHQTDKIKFGLDGKLYIGQGSFTDAGTPASAEGPLNGTILRVDVDNPQVEVFATGLRQPFGLTVHPDNGQIFSTDVGKGEFCNGCADDSAPPEEVNWIVAGGNYGFPLCDSTPVAGVPACAGVRGPLLQYPPHMTPTALAFYNGPQAGAFNNQLLVAIYKNYLNAQNVGGDLRRVVVDGTPETGFTMRDDGFVIRLQPIDPGDGPVDAGIDPISGDIYLARFDPNPHRDPAEHHHFIYRIHRTGSDALPIIGAVTPAAVKAGSSGLTISIIGRHLKAGATIIDVTDNAVLTTRQGADRYELLTDLPANVIATDRTIQLAVRNPDGGQSNSQPFAITKGDPTNPPPDQTPQITSMFVYKKKRPKVVAQVHVGANPKKFHVVVDGTNFDAGAQLLVNNTPLTIETRSTTELVASFLGTNLLAATGTLTIQVKNSTGKISNTVTVSVVP